MMIMYWKKCICKGYNNDFPIYLINHVELMFKNAKIEAKNNTGFSLCDSFIHFA